MSKIDIAHLTPKERLDLIGELWDSLDEGADPLPAEVKETLDQRNAEFDTQRANAVPWPEVRNKLRPKHG